MSAERRVKVVWVPEYDVWDLIRSQGQGGIVSYLDLGGVPADCKVERVIHRPERRAFGFLLSHPSFDAVPPGATPPEALEACEWQRIAVRYSPLSSGS